MSSRTVAILAFAAACMATSANAQLVPNFRGTLGQVTNALPPLPTQNVPVIDGNLGNQQQAAQQLAQPSLDRIGIGDTIEAFSQATLANLREQRLRSLLRDHRDELDRDQDHNPVRKGELIVTDPDAASLAAAIAVGFSPLREENILGLHVVVLAIPAKEDDVRDALKELRKAAPDLAVDYNHIFEPAGGPLIPASHAMIATSAAATAGGKTIAIIDGGVASHDSMATASIRQRGFVGNVVPTGHGTAVASLLVGSQGKFHGAARGATLLVADIYGGNPAAGSATAIARALAWAADNGANVVNISLVGPSNILIEKAIRRLRARGIHIVAAVGNDGPAAPAQYPASYEGVIAVTGVDAKGRALREAGRAKHLDFAAPGADMAAALLSGGYAEVRGTSFAAPLVAARLAATGSVAALSHEAIKGKGKVGRGIVCSNCAIPPKSVTAK